MITVANINGVPETNHDKGFGCHSDNNNFYFFENAEDKAAFYAALQNGWDKYAYTEVINQAHSDWYRSIYARKPDLDYSSIGEIGLYLTHPDFGAQAQALQQLWWDSVDILYTHLEEVTEATALTPEDFINSLPKFDN